MGLLDFDKTTPEYRSWKSQQARINVEVAESLFRIVEMILVTGLVRFLELRLKPPAVASTLLAAMIAIYAYSKMKMALYPAVERYEISESRKRKLFWLFRIIAAVLFATVTYGVNTVIPILAVNQP